MPNDPIFQSIFGDDWARLPPVMRRHYANRPFSDDHIIVQGKMTVTLSFIARLLAPVMRLTKTLAPYAGDHIPTEVHFTGEQGSRIFCLTRIFTYPSGTYIFKSRMVPLGGTEIVEMMQAGIGWHCAYSFDGQRIWLRHKGYKCRLWGRMFSLPLGRMIGHGLAWEEALDDTRFRMYMEIRHPLFGRIYAYEGEFELKG